MAMGVSERAGWRCQVRAVRRVYRLHPAPLAPVRQAPRPHSVGEELRVQEISRFPPDLLQLCPPR